MIPFPWRISRWFGACLCTAIGGTLLDAATPPSLVSLVEKEAASLPRGGIVLAEVRDGKTSFASAGKIAPISDVPAEKILFELGSITKVFTGLLLAQAVLEGKAELSDSIAKHLPPDVTLKPGASAITLEQLATHTSGLPRLPPNLAPANPADPYADYTVAQLYDFLRRHEPAAAPPQPMAYSNLGFGLLGHLLERILGHDYGTLIATRIAQPIGLSDTAIALSEDQRARFAAPFSGSVQVPPWHLPTLAGAGALRSTAHDMALFAEALLSGRNPALAKSWDLARQPRAELAGGAGHAGLGILMGTRNGSTVYNHAGGTGGSRTLLELVPVQSHAVVILANNDAIVPGALVVQAHAKRAAAPATKAREETPIDPAKLVEYTGVYQLDTPGSFTFVLDEHGRLRARLTGQGFLPVFHAGNDRFFARTVAAEFQFARDNDGKIASVTLHQNGRELPARRTDTPAPTVNFLPVEKLRAYAGRYQLAPNILFEIEVRGTNLLVKLTGQPAFPVFNDAPDHFVYDVVEAALTFERNGEGNVAAVVLHQNGIDQRAPRIAETAPKE